MAAAMIKDVTYDEFNRLGHDAFEQLRSGAIFAIRQVPLITHLRRAILHSVSEISSDSEQSHIATFLETRQYPGDREISLLLSTVKSLRDARYLSCLFVDVVCGMGLPEPVLIDTGHVRFVLPHQVNRLRQHVNDGWFVPEDFYQPRLVPSEPEAFFSRPLAGNPHRDLDRPHYTFQMNFWFPLHAVAEHETLILFPEVYRSDVPYYAKPADLLSPWSWGYGQPLQVPLEFGDMLLFHSQHLHASPTQAQHRNRVSVELRAVAGCEDDNSSYRRLFWNVRNFDPVFPRYGSNGRFDRDSRVVSDRMLRPGIRRVSDPAIQLGDVIDACYHELFQRVFASPEAARRAGDSTQDDDAFRFSELPDDAFATLARILTTGPVSEDRLVALMRAAMLHKLDDVARAIAQHLIARSHSYFWLLETGRLCGRAGWLAIARVAFEGALAAAQSSHVRLGKYIEDLPTRSPGAIQLLPAHAARAARALIRKCNRLIASEHEGTAVLDYRLFYPDVTISRSFETYDILSLRSHSLHVALPRSSFFHPETLLERDQELIIGRTEAEVERAIPEADRRLVERRSHAIHLIEEYRRYNIIRWLNGVYGVPQGAGEISFVDEDVLVRPAVVATTEVEHARRLIDRVHVEANLESALEPQLVAEGYGGTSYNVVLHGDKYYGVHQADGAFDLSRLAAGSYSYTVVTALSLADVGRALGVQSSSNGGAARAIASPPPASVTTDDFLELAFAGRRETLIRSAVEGLRGQQQLLLIGSPTSVNGFAARLRDSGYDVEFRDWSTAGRFDPSSCDRVPVFGTVPSNAREWEIFREWSSAAGGRLKTIWRTALPLAPVAAMQDKFEYNSPTFEGMCDLYTAQAFHGPHIRPLMSALDVDGKTVVEFGPSDGVHTGALVAFGARRITAIEARPENVVKLLAAKFAFHWDHVDVVAENFHAVLPERYGRFDIAYAHGVYYHSNSPLLFLDNLTRLSDVVVIGGWCATDQKPVADWEEFRYGGRTYRGKTYVEPTHFLSGVQTQSVYLERESLFQFFTDRSYSCDEISLENMPNVTGLFTRFVARKQSGAHALKADS